MPPRLEMPSVEPSANPAADQLWVAVLERIVGRTAHEIKGALNGVSVNLEVVRSRAAKPDSPASAVTKFAEAAATQFEGVIAMTDALLGLARPYTEPADVGGVLRRMGVLLVPAARADGRQLTIDGTADGPGTTSVRPTIARALIGAALLAGIDSSNDVMCRVDAGPSGAVLRIEARDGATLEISDAAVTALAADAGIDIQAESSAIFISFPR
jgi:hypothetical protein